MKPRILVIGGGGMGRRHIHALLATKRCEVACVEPKPASLPVDDVYPSLSKAQGRIDGAIVASPTPTHIPYGLWCATRGIPFLLEKPISTTEKGIRELIQKTKVVAGVAYPRRHAPAILALRALDLGALKMIRTNFSQDFRKYRPDYRKTYYAKISTGGGILLDALSHHIDLASFFGGPIAEVSAYHGRLAFKGTQGEDAAVISLRFENGILGSIVGNQFQKPNEDSIELIGTKGNARYERVSGVLSWNFSDRPKWRSKRMDGDWDKIILRQAGKFLDSVEDGSPLPTSLEDAWRTLNVVLAARKSGT